MQKRNALGRGLDSLILGDLTASPEGGSAINEISISEIDANPEQPRTTFDEETLRELADSIRELGIIQPLSLRLKDDGRYQIIAGERRWRAAQLAGLERVPAYVRTVSDSELTEMALIENIQREDLNAIEVALTFRKLIDTYNLTQERLSSRLGKKRSTIANHLRLLKLPAEIQFGLRDRKLDMGHARALLSVDDPRRQLQLYNLIIKEGLSVRRVEEMAREINAALQRGENPEVGPKRTAPAADTSREYRFFTEEMAGVFNTPVKFKRSEDGKGSITLKFESDDQLQQLMQLFERLK